MRQSAVGWLSVGICAHRHIWGCVKGHGEAGRIGGKGMSVWYDYELDTNKNAWILFFIYFLKYQPQHTHTHNL